MRKIILAFLLIFSIASVSAVVDPFTWVSDNYYGWSDAYVVFVAGYPNVTIQAAESIKNGEELVLLYNNGELGFIKEDVLLNLPVDPNRTAQNFSLYSLAYKVVVVDGFTGITEVPSWYPGPLAVCYLRQIFFYDYDGNYKGYWTTDASDDMLDLEYDPVHDRLLASSFDEGIFQILSNGTTIPVWDYWDYNSIFRRWYNAFEYIDMESNPETYDMMLLTHVFKQMYLDGSMNYNIPGKDTNIDRGSFVTTGIAFTNNRAVFANPWGFWIYNVTLKVQKHMEKQPYTPVVKLLSPAQNATLNYSNVNFSFNVTDIINISSCSLILNNEVIQTMSPVARGVAQVFVQELENGNYKWKVRCTDIGNRSGESDARDVTIDKCADSDNDSICDISDNCPLVNNYNQLDRDYDSLGDVCDNYTIPPDRDQDTDVDQEDFGMYQVCITGENNSVEQGCEWADFDQDEDVDMSDFSWFQTCVSGPRIPISNACYALFNGSAMHPLAATSYNMYPICINGEQRLCQDQNGVFAGSKETCTLENWPGCIYNDFSLINAVSRKTHGPAGNFDINMSLNPIDAKVEPRANGPEQLIFTFSYNISAASCSNILLSSGICQDVKINGNAMIVNMSGAKENSCLNVTLNGITSLDNTSLTGDNNARLIVIKGETSGDKLVDILDLSVIKAQMFKPITNSNFRQDIYADGIINILDLGTVKNNLFKRASCS